MQGVGFGIRNLADVVRVEDLVRGEERERRVLQIRSDVCRLCSGFGFRGSGFGARGSGFGVWGSGFRVQGAGFRVQGLGDGVVLFGEMRVQGLGSMVQGFGRRVGVGFRVKEGGVGV